MGRGAQQAWDAGSLCARQMSGRGAALTGAAWVQYLEHVEGSLEVSLAAWGRLCTLQLAAGCAALHLMIRPSCTSVRPTACGPALLAYHRPPPRQSFVACQADGTKDGRMMHALSETGSAVFVGGLTALAGGFLTCRAAYRHCA